jgi:hypothetical protein
MFWAIGKGLFVATIVTSQTRIANRALILLGTFERINSVQDTAPLAEQINDLWHESRRAAIAAHPWNFAIERVQLNETAFVPAFGYSRKFALPPDCLRWLPPSRDDYDGFEGEEEGGFILSDAAAPLNVRYIRDVEDVTAWPVHFSVFMGYQIAMDLAESATQISGNVDDMAVKREEALMEARKLDGLASGNRSRGDIEILSRWTAARRNPYYSRGTYYSRVPG